MKRRRARLIRVFRSPLDRTKGRLVGPGLDLPCALGRGGPGHRKREGDGLTPIGRFTALAALYRPDRMGRPLTGVPVGQIRPDLGWADDPKDRRYNRPIPLPAACGHERMWRDDALYDLVLDLSYNRGPIIRGRGSAIFLHSARPGFLPTEGCVAVDRRRIRQLTEQIGPDTIIEIVG
jgi:L,D-peptidoglycan transpeptidase YkuD (ErfK/YbiS/YcfS/YnhG family)